MERARAPVGTGRASMVALAVGCTAYALLQGLVAPALPSIGDAFEASPSATGWVMTGFLLSAAVSTPIVGRLGDVLGKERMTIVLVLLLTIGTLISAVAPTIGWMIAGRVVQGSGAAIYALAFGIARDVLPREAVPGAIGMLASLLGIGSIVGATLAGLIVDRLSFRWIFLVVLVLLVPAPFAVGRYVPRSPRRSAIVNWWSATLLASGLTSALVGVTQSTYWGWTSVRTVALLLIGGALIAGWAVRDLTAEAPLLDMRLLRRRRLWTLNLAGLLLGVGQFSSFIVISLLVQEPVRGGFGIGATAVTGALFLLPSALAHVLMALLAGRLERRHGSYAPFTWGATLTAVGFATLCVAHRQIWGVLLASAVIGAGIGLSVAASANLTVQAVPAAQTGEAGGVHVVVRTIGGVIGSQVIATSIAANISPGTGLPTERGYVIGIAIITALVTLSVPVALMIPRQRESDGGISRRATLADRASWSRSMTVIPYPNLDDRERDDPGLAELTSRIAGPRGQLPNLYRLLLHSQTVTEGWLALSTAIRFETTLDDRIREIVVVRVGVLTDCAYELHHHVPLAASAGVTADELEAICGDDLSALDETDRSVVRLVDAIVARRPVEPSLVAELSASVGDEAMVEIAATTAYYIAVAHLLIAMAIQIEGSPTG